MKNLIHLAVLLENIVAKPDEHFVIVDGDHIGNSAATPLLHNDVEKAIKVSKLIHAGQSFISWWSRHVGGRSLIDGGDNSVLLIPQIANLEELRDGYKLKTGFTLSCGTGRTTEEADKALVVAKWRGRDQIAKYDAQCEVDFKKAQAEANDAVKLQAEIGESTLAEDLGIAQDVEDWSGAAEGLEISAYDWNLLVKIAREQPVEIDDAGLGFLKEAGLIMFTPASRSPQLTELGKAYLR